MLRQPSHVESLKNWSQSDILFKNMPYDIKDISDSGEFEGYASAFGNKDSGGDVVVKGAFSDWIKEFPVGRIKVLNQHRWTEPIGKGVEMKEDDYGLFVRGKILTSTTLGNDVYLNMKDGILDRLSIGYFIVDSKYEPETETLYLLKLGLPEFSIVTFAMNDNAIITVVKSNEVLFTDLKTAKSVRDVEKILKGATLTSARGDTFKLNKDIACFLANRFKLGEEREADNPDIKEQKREADSLEPLITKLQDLAATFN